MKPLQEMRPPEDMEAFNRPRGMFAFYVKWIPEFSNKIHLLVKVNQFPLSEENLQAFGSLKSDLKVTFRALNLPFKFNYDNSDVELK